MAEPYDPAEPARGAPQASWRGGATRAPARHRWQSDWTTQTRHEERRWRDIRRLRFAGLMIATLALLGLFLYVLIYRPRQTPALVVLAPAYEYPLSPLAWSQEDGAGLAELGGRTLALVDDSDAWRARDRGLRSLERQLRRLGERRGRDQVAIIYFAMHGVVDDSRRPCLIPPGASPLTPETWVPIEEILQRIDETPELRGAPKLVVFDAVRSLTDWNAGVLYNTFAERLTETLTQTPRKDFSILLSAGPGEQSWVAPELKGSVFAHYFQLGLAGEADLKSEAGNGDRRVSLGELSGYLRRRVDGWAQTNRGASQQPVLIASGNDEIQLAWSLGRRSLDRLRTQPFSSDVRLTAAAPPDLDRLWERHARIDSAEALRFAPLAWKEFEQKLLWLEAASAAGAAYRDLAGDTARELEAWATQVESRSASAAGDFLARERRYAAQPSGPSKLAVYSLAAGRQYGGLAAPTIREGNAAVTAFLESPGQAEDLDRAASLAPARPLAETHLLRLLQRSRVSDLWVSPPLVRAVAVHRRGEELAAPGDPRLLGWTRSSLEAGDALRRAAEDQLFIGGDAAGEEDSRVADAETLSQLWDDAEGFYDRARANGEVVTRALRLRDRAYHELPYLARWLTDPRTQRLFSSNGREVNEQLLPLIRRTHRLAADLSDHSLASGGDAPFLDRLDEVEQDLDRLWQAFRERISTLETAKKDEPQAAPPIEVALAIPQLSLRSRQVLKERLAALSQPGNEPQVAAAANNDHQPHDPGEYASRMATIWREPPALALLADALPAALDEDAAAIQESTSSVNWVEARGAETRRLLRALPETIAAISDSALPGSEVASDAAEGTGDLEWELRAARDRLSQAERAALAASGFWFPAPVEDPSLRLRRWDLQQLLFWRAGRMLDDFWAGDGSDSPPFFAVAAGGELAAAASLFPLRGPTQRQYDELANLLAQRRTAAERGLEVAASDILLVSPNSEATTEVNVHAASLPAGAVPAGRATVLLRDGEGRLPGASAGVSLPLGRTSDSAVAVPFALRGENLAGRGPLLEATVFFRGHEFTAPLVLEAPGGAIVGSRPYQYGPARITVEGRRQRQASLVFILDCSQSMSAALELEAPPAENAPPRQVRRFDVAEDALKLLLDDLAQRSDWRVGVRLFGHRVGFDRERPADLEPIYQTGYAREIPPQLRPAHDEEQVLPLGRFDSVEAGKISTLLESVRPWGETPLYLSIDRALRDFDSEPAGAERFIVAITDGANRQTNPAPQFSRTAASVLSTWQSRRARVYIVGFDLPAAERVAEPEFRSLTEATGGEYIAAESAQQLIEAMQRVLGPGEFRVSDGGGNEIARVNVGEAAVVEPAPLSQQPYTVAVDSLEEQVFLEGGEALELVATPTRGRLESVVYQKGSPQFHSLISDEGTAMQMLGVHRPVTDASGVWFPFSVQDRDRRFTQRPAETWIEVTPHAPGEDPSPLRYIFYDAPIEPDTPVPVWNCLARQWPVERRQAQVRFWCKMERSPGRFVRLADVADRPPAEGSGHPIPDLSGATYQVRTQRGTSPGDPFRVAIIERHSAESPGVGSVKVEMSPLPLRSIHQFDQQHRLVLHTFEYATAEDNSGLEREIVFTPFSAVEESSIRLDEPVIVDIAGAGNLIELNAPK